MAPVERSSSTPQPLRMRVWKPGDGARLKPLWLPWLGNHFDEAMDSLDQGTMLTSGGFLELVLVAEDRSSGDVVGMLLAGPPHHFFEAYPAELRPVVAQLVVKLSGIAVAPERQHEGIGTKLVRRAVGEFRRAEYRWMYGQFAHQRNLTEFYKGSAPGLVDTRGGWFSGRFCGRVDHLKFGWGEFAEGSLSTSSVVLGFDPDHDRQA